MTKVIEKPKTPNRLENLKAKRDRLQAEFDAKYPGFYQIVANLSINRIIQGGI